MLSEVDSPLYKRDNQNTLQGNLVTFLLAERESKKDVTRIERNACSIFRMNDPKLSMSTVIPRFYKEAVSLVYF